jgi:hypothetical protein
MNKLFIGLLIIAAATGAFFILRKKGQIKTGDNIQKELIIGKWKIDSLQSGKDSSHNFLVGIMGIVDSNTLRYAYEFTKEGTILRSLNDSVSSDSSRYAWNKENHLVWSEKGDTTGSILKIARLNKDTLQLQAMDSMIILFTKLK